MRALSLLLIAALATVPSACARTNVPPEATAAATPAETEPAGGSGIAPILIIAALALVLVIGASIASARADDPWDDLDGAGGGSGPF